MAVNLSELGITEVVSGNARGADKLGEQWARRHGVPIKLMPANWADKGPKAALIRNAEMAEYADALIAIWDGKSTGTLHMIDCMDVLGKPVLAFRLTTRGGIKVWKDHAVL